MFKWAKTSEKAVAPFKNIETDTGFDLVLIEKIKEANGIYYYDTCIKVEPPEGFYFDLVGRSSISKTGWMLANSVGILDTSYRGSIIVALSPSIPNAKEIQLPARIVQIIPRKLHLLKPVEVTEDDLSITDRDTGGFGSSG